jgi:hypothetical protein
MHVQRPVPDLRRDPRVRCSDRLAAVVMRALAKNPAGRFPDAAAMRAVLEACAPEAETSSEVLDAGPTSPDFVLEPTAPAVARPAATVLRTLPSAALDRPRWRAAVIVLSCVAMLAVAAAALIVDRVPEVPAATPLATPAPTVPVPVAVPAAPAPPAAVPVVPVVPVGIPQPEPNPPPETRPPDPTPQKQVEEERDVHRKRAPRPGEKKGSALEVEI